METVADPLAALRRKRLLFKSWHRGTQESDLLLGSFADSCLAGLDTSQLCRFEALLECSDPDLFEWILGGGVPPAEHDHDVLHLLCAYWARRQRKPTGQFRTDITSAGE
jgi:antitoxin CptB